MVWFRDRTRSGNFGTAAPARNAEGEVCSNAACQGSVRQKTARLINYFLNAVGGVETVLRDVAPDFEKIVDCLGSELVAHAWRLSAHALFFFSNVERTWSASTSSPRRA